MEDFEISKSKSSETMTVSPNKWGKIVVSKEIAERIFKYRDSIKSDYAKSRKNYAFEAGDLLGSQAHELLHKNVKEAIDNFTWLAINTICIAKDESKLIRDPAQFQNTIESNYAKLISYVGHIAVTLTKNEDVYGRDIAAVYGACAILVFELGGDFEAEIDKRLKYANC